MEHVFFIPKHILTTAKAGYLNSRVEAVVVVTKCLALTKYANVTRQVVGQYESLCQKCQKQNKRITTKDEGVEPILSKDFGSRSYLFLRSK